MQHVVEGAAPPDVGRLLIQIGGIGGVDPLHAGAAIFVHGGFVGTKAPAEKAALVHRMQRVDEQVRAAKRNPGRDATVAEAGENIGVGRAGEAGLGQPCRQFAEELFVHAAIIQASARAVAAASIFGLARPGSEIQASFRIGAHAPSPGSIIASVAGRALASLCATGGYSFRARHKVAPRNDDGAFGLRSFK